MSSCFQLTVSVRTKGIMEKHQREMLMKQNRRSEQRSKLETAIEQDNQRFMDDQNQQQAVKNLKNLLNH